MELAEKKIERASNKKSEWFQATTDNTDATNASKLSESVSLHQEARRKSIEITITCNACKFRGSKGQKLSSEGISLAERPLSVADIVHES